MGSIQPVNNFAIAHGREHDDQFNPFSSQTGAYDSSMEYFHSHHNSQAPVLSYVTETSSTFDGLNAFSFSDDMDYATPNGTTNYTIVSQQGQLDPRMTVRNPAVAHTQVYGSDNDPSFGVRYTFEPPAVDQSTLQVSTGHNLQQKLDGMEKESLSMASIRYGHPTPDSSVTPPSKQSPSKEQEYEQDGGSSNKRNINRSSKTSEYWEEDEGQAPTSLATPPKRKRGRKSKKDSQSEEEKRKGREKFLERNRFAAAKCRENKKKWQANLQDHNSILDQENARLRLQVAQLQHHLDHLRNCIMAHINCKDEKIHASLAASGNAEYPLSGMPAVTGARKAQPPSISLRGTEFQLDGHGRRNSAPGLSTPHPMTSSSSHRRNHSISTPGWLGRAAINDSMSHTSPNHGLFGDGIEEITSYFDFNDDGDMNACYTPTSAGPLDLQ
jgi:hypothetical protein